MKDSKSFYLLYCSGDVVFEALLHSIYKSNIIPFATQKKKIFKEKLVMFMNAFYCYVIYCMLMFYIFETKICLKRPILVCMLLLGDEIHVYCKVLHLINFLVKKYT